ncbi:MAG: serine/threonine-protein phosphatase [Micromonosporaceae bacterium]|nr:serine/threonine-protein phosphatase [Micromonosporaceae bacterium]
MASVRAGMATDPGRVRQVNEDRALAGPDLFAVADGMGGHAAGDVASSMAVDRLARLVRRPRLTPADVTAELAACNRDILAAAQPGTARAGMGTTVAGLVLVNVAGRQHWLVFNIGDSRVYRFVDGQLVRVTIDHSEVEELVASGAIAANEARSHPRRSVVTRVLGMNPPPEADVWLFPPTPGERFLICSDGLSSELDDPDIAAVLRAEPIAQAAADALVARAVAAGGRDNVTVVVVDHVVDTGSDLEEDTLRRPRNQVSVVVPGRPHSGEAA